MLLPERGIISFLRIMQPQMSGRLFWRKTRDSPASSFS